MIIKKEEIFNSSNILSIIRLFLSIPLIMLFNYWGQQGITEVIIILIITAAITDILDGYLARRMNQITEFGKIIDPLADKVAMTVVLLGFLLNELLPLYYIIIVVSRDILILLGGIYIAKRTGKVLPSNFLGKITVLLIGFVILLRLFDLKDGNIVFDVLFKISLIMIFVSFIVYFYRAFKVIKEYK